jgi:hypothetical protein
LTSLGHFRTAIVSAGDAWKRADVLSANDELDAEGREMTIDPASTQIHISRKTISRGTTLPKHEQRDNRGGDHGKTE